MKKAIIGLSLLVLSGCSLTYAQNASELRANAGGGGLISITSRSFVVDRSFSSVVSVLRRMSSQCYNHTKQAQHVYRAGAYGPQSFATRYQYSSRVTVSGGTAALPVRVKQLNNSLGNAMAKQPENGFIGILLDAKRVNSGTQVTYYGPNIGMRKQSELLQEAFQEGRVECAHYN